MVVETVVVAVVGVVVDVALQQAPIVTTLQVHIVIFPVVVQMVHLVGLNIPQIVLVVVVLTARRAQHYDPSIQMAPAELHPDSRRVRSE
eukprot:UN10540